MNPNSAYRKPYPEWKRRGKPFSLRLTPEDRALFERAAETMRLGATRWRSADRPPELSSFILDACRRRAKELLEPAGSTNAGKVPGARGSTKLQLRARGGR